MKKNSREDKRQEWDKVIDELCSGLDLSSPEGREAAYAECLEYAEREMAGDFLGNAFLAHAARRLGTTQVRREVVRERVTMPEEALLHLVYDPVTGPVLTGNREGLEYLSRILKELSTSPLFGEHVHLYWDEPPFCGETYGLCIYLEDDDWFNDSAYDFMNGAEETAFSQRELSGEEVIALQIIFPLNSSLSLTPQKLYLVQETAKQSAEEVWTKQIREEEDRMWIFTIRDDMGQLQRLKLDLDDPEISFLTRDDLDQLLH